MRAIDPIERINELERELEAKDAYAERLRGALILIEQWKDFPKCDDGYSFAYNYGSNGERDHLRVLARTLERDKRLAEELLVAALDRADELAKERDEAKEEARLRDEYMTVEKTLRFEATEYAEELMKMAQSAQVGLVMADAHLRTKYPTGIADGDFLCCCVHRSLAAIDAALAENPVPDVARKASIGRGLAPRRVMPSC